MLDFQYSVSADTITIKPLTEEVSVRMDYHYGYWTEPFDKTTIAGPDATRIIGALINEGFKGEKIQFREDY